MVPHDIGAFAVFEDFDFLDQAVPVRTNVSLLHRNDISAGLVKRFVDFSVAALSDELEDLVDLVWVFVGDDVVVLFHFK